VAPLTARDIRLSATRSRRGCAVTVIRELRVVDLGMTASAHESLGCHPNPWPFESRPGWRRTEV